MVMISSSLKSISEWIHIIGERNSKQIQETKKRNSLVGEKKVTRI